jgi:mRNA interferase HigB
MVVIAISRLRDFWQQPGRRDAEDPLRAWFKEASAANWGTPADIKRSYARASVLNANRVVFNIGGNKYRLIVVVYYRVRTIYIRFIGTHAEYDRIDANTV